MDNFNLKKYLIENKVTMNSKLLAEQVDSKVKKAKHSKILKENRSSSPKLLDFIDGADERTQMIYDQLGFDVKEDDEANNEFVAVLDFKGYDWLSVLGTLEDCEREGVKPFMTWNGRNYEFEEAMELADSKAASGKMDDAGRGKRLENKGIK